MDFKEVKMKNQIKEEIKSLPYGRHNIDSNDIKAVADVLKSDFYFWS